MIELYMKNYNNNGHKTQTPIKLVIEDIEYVGEDLLFEKLVDYQGYKIKVIHLGARTDTKNYIIHGAQEGPNGPEIDLRDY